MKKHIGIISLIKNLNQLKKKVGKGPGKSGKAHFSFRVVET